MRDFQIRLASKNEGLDYEDATGVYHFNVRLSGKVWHVDPTPTKGDRFEPLLLSEAERWLLFDRIEEFLSRIWWLGVWPVRYQVKFAKEAL